MRESYNSFSDFLVQKRKELGKTSRGLAKEINITATYMSDIENGRRNPPEKHLETLAQALNLTSEEKVIMYDLAAIDRDSAPIDLTGYIMQTDLARAALRTAKKKDLSDETWKKIIKIMEEE